MSVLIGENLSSNFSELPSHEDKFSEGETGELRVFLSRPLYQEEYDELVKRITSRGVVLTEVIQGEGMLVIRFRKAIVPLLIIAGALGTLGTAILGWQLFKDLSFWGVPWWAWAVGGVAVVYLVLKD